MQNEPLFSQNYNFAFVLLCIYHLSYAVCSISYSIYGDGDFVGTVNCQSSQTADTSYRIQVPSFLCCCDSLSEKKMLACCTLVSPLQVVRRWNCNYQLNSVVPRHLLIFKTSKKTKNTMMENKENLALATYFVFLK